MEIFIVIIIFIIIVGFYFSFCKVINRKIIKKIDEEIIYLLKNKVNSYVKEKNGLLVKTLDKTFLFNVIFVEKNSQLTINNKATWCLRYGSKKEGKSYPNKRFINEVSSIIQKSEIDDKILKVFILYKNANRILMYLNESELKVITPNDSPYGYKVLLYEELDKFLNDLI